MMRKRFPQVPILPAILLVLTPYGLWASESGQGTPDAQPAASGRTLQRVRAEAGLFGGFSSGGADGLESGSVFGASASFFFTRRLGLEAAVRRRSLDVAPTPSNQLSGGSLDSTVVTGALVLRFPAERVAPYVLAGVAYFSNTFEVDAAVSSRLAGSNFQATEELKSTVGFNVGAGAEVLVAGPLALFGEARYLVGSVDTRAELADTISGTTAEVAGSQDLNGLEIRGGVRLVFASRKGR
jgi:opacity protein-like surface antigen